jgi:hypothetical protein
MQIYSPVVTMVTAERTLFLATSNNSFGEYDMTANVCKMMDLYYRNPFIVGKTSISIKNARTYFVHGKV